MSDDLTLPAGTLRTPWLVRRSGEVVLRETGERLGRTERSEGRRWRVLDATGAELVGTATSREWAAYRLCREYEEREARRRAGGEG